MEDPKEKIKYEINRIKDIVNQAKIYKCINSIHLLYSLELVSTIYNSPSTS